nr:RNA-directed DNA polymerase, eukaryota, reverse transcriptase zinc-binding domain protein [Tanacetum cinerariifolium]
MSARTSILINGSHTSEFSLKRGLRQRDHLSPFLFIIVMEGLHMALNDGIASNMFHEVRIGSNIHLSHLFYADDVSILSDWNQNDMKNITRILNIFYIAFGLKINFHKSDVFGVGVSNSEVVSMAACTGCEADCFISQRILNGSWEWDWCRPITMGRSKTKFDNLIIDISNMKIDDLVESDTCVWSLSNDDSFSVNSVDKHSLPSLFPSTRWYKMIPKKVNVFMWRMLLDRLPNRLNLSFRGLDIDSISCMACNGHVESNDHIFFTCDTVVAIWNLVRSWIDLSLPSFLSCEDWTNWFDSWHVSKEKRAVCIPSLRLLVGIFGVLGTISHSTLIL